MYMYIIVYMKIHKYCNKNEKFTIFAFSPVGSHQIILF